MNNFFENHFEEINLITNRSKKESRTTFTRLQKASVYKLESFNKEIIYENIYNLEGINVHQVSEEGKVLFGSSDRIYLPDVATRLYQGLDDILKSYKNHKVHSTEFKPKGNDDNTSNIDHYDLADWDTEYFKEVLDKVYDSIDEIIREKTNLIFELEGYHSLWQIFNPEQKSREFDEYLLSLTYTVESRENGEIILKKSQKVKVNDIRSKRVNFQDAIDEINFASNSYLLVQADEVTKKLNAEAVVLDENLTNQLLLKLYSINPGHTIFKESNLRELNNYECISESYDKFGNCCDQERCLDEDYLLLRQTFFNKAPKFSFRNFEFKREDELDEEKDLEETLNKILKKYNLKNILFIGGSRDINFEEECSEDIIMEPSIKVFYDGKKVRFLDLDFVEIASPEEINLMGGNKPMLSKFQDTTMFVGMNGFSYSLLPIKNINLI